jgi:hypothetical protein
MCSKSSKVSVIFLVDIDLQRGELLFISLLFFFFNGNRISHKVGLAARLSERLYSHQKPIKFGLTGIF